MQLTLINFFKKTVPGHIFRGKRRLIKPVSKRAIETLRRDYERQEQNMLWLRHPYLTVVSIIYYFFFFLKITLFLRRRSQRVMPKSWERPKLSWRCGTTDAH